MKRTSKRFLEYLRDKNMSEATIKSYGGDLKKFILFIEKRYRKYLSPGDITRDMVQSFMTYLGEVGFKKKNCPSSRARKLAMLKSFFKYAYHEGLSRNNPALDIVTPKVKQKEPSFLTEEEIKRLLRVASRSSRSIFQNRRDHAIIALFISTGARLNELVSINIGDFDLKQKTVKLKRKGGEEQILPLSDELIKILGVYLRLRRRRTRSRALFISSRNKRIDSNSVWHVVKRLCAKAKLHKPRLSPHSLRHSFATLLLSKGENLRNIQALMNHKNLTTTARYLHTQDVELKKAVNKISLS